MSIKKYFEKNKSYKIQSSSSLEELGTEVESERYIKAKVEDIKRYVPPIDFSTASNFVKYGSAERYYVDSIQRIYNQYPYDGALSEQQKYHNSSSYLDSHFFDNLYPRTNGLISISADGWGTAEAGLTGLTGGYGLPANKEYIEIVGGPHTASGGMIGKELYKTFELSNVYETGSKRYSNLHLEPSVGNTVEFWFRKAAFGNLSSKEVVFDLWNSQASSSAAYGRFRIEVTGAAAGAAFRVTLLSGTTGITNNPIGSAVTVSSLANWHHYAFTVKNNGANLQLEMYKDGEMVDQQTTGSAINQVITGALNARLGALITSSAGLYLGKGDSGWGKLSASLDEFRYWKSDRTSEQIGRNWWTNIYGGTNTDDANVDLGVYYKFNEGITQTASIDANVLDYSGRISNGNWVGYPGNQARSTESAIVLGSASAAEYKDPIIYSFHPDVSDLEIEYKDKGIYFDYSNNSSIINSIPQWIIDDEQVNGSGQLGRLIQIVSTYFDTLQSQVSNVPKLGNINYPSASYKPLPFINELLESQGLTTGEIFADSTIVEKLQARNDDFNFTDEISDIKNLIYQNIYNNLTNIYKTKGTENSFRNLFRCFGVDDELLKLRMYANNAEFQIRNNYRNTYTKKPVVDFNHPDRFNSVIYQYPETGNGSSTGFISGSNDGTQLENQLAVTIEADVYFPKKLTARDSGGFFTPFTTGSLFGVHEASLTNTDLTHQSADSASIQIFAVRDDVESPNVSFAISSSLSSFGTYTSSSVIKDVYNNNKWTLALRVKPTNYPVQGIVSETTDDGYTIELYGVNLYGDIVENQFTVTASATQAKAIDFLTVAKRVFAGAHRTNTTGGVLQQSDVRISGVRYWMSYLSDAEVQSHARDPLNFGVDHARENTYLLNQRLSASYVPKMETLALNWTFQNLTGSNTAGQFTISDISSGSTANQNRHGWISKIVNLQNTGRGSEFQSDNSGTIKQEFFYTNRQEPPDVASSSDMINIMQGTDEYFTRESRPLSHHFMIEKSMNATISEEMLKFFAGVVEFSRLIGAPVNRYRGEYKELRLLRELFFERMQNEPDLDKYMEYYKWIDNSIDVMISQLIPAGASFSDGIQNVIESHVLERSKYRYKFPSMEMSFDDPETPILGVKELLYNWKFNHAPLDNSQSNHCQWWKERVSRTDVGVTSGDATVDSNRNEILESATTLHSASAPTLAKSDGTTYKGSTFVLRNLSTVQRFSVDRPRIIKGGANFEPSKKIDLTLSFTHPHGPLSSINVPLNIMSVGLDPTSRTSTEVTIQERVCKDELIPNLKDKLETSVTIARNFDGLEDYNEKMKGTMVLPFNVISSSVRSGYAMDFMSDFQSGANIVNMHQDVYGTINEIPMQGPFTEKYVGGHQSRHIDINHYDTSLTTEGGGATVNNLDDQYSRPEAFRILFGAATTSSGSMGIVGADYGGPYPDTSRQRATMFRDEYAKRPLNIRNIQQTTGSSPTKIGNYTHIYEVVSTFGRFPNSIEFIKTEGSSLPGLIGNTGTRNLHQTTNLNSLVGVSAGAAGNFFGRKNKTVTQLSNRFPVGANKTVRNYSSSNAVIASQFSAPGGPEIQSLGYLDIKSQEKSVYNALPYRNLTVRGSGSGEVSTIRVNSQLNRREGLRTVLTRHCGQFGIDSVHGQVFETTYPSSPNFHKVNRNPLSVFELDTSSSTSTTGDELINTKGCTWGDADDRALFLIEEEAQRKHLTFDKAMWDASGSIEWTLSTWMRLPDDGTRRILLHMGRGTNASNAIYSLEKSTGSRQLQLQFQSVESDGGSPRTTSFKSPEDVYTSGSWFHFAMAISGAVTDLSNTFTASFYVNGTPVTVTPDNTPKDYIETGSKVFNNCRGHASLDIVYPWSVGGSYKNSSALPWTSGSVDEMAIYTGSLNASHISTIYNSGTPCDLTSSNSPRSGSLQSWWRWGDAATDLVPFDRTPAGATGTQLISVNSINKITDVVGDAHMFATARSGSGFRMSATTSSFPPPNGCELSTVTTETTVPVEAIKYDNYFVSHAIPQTDFQYTWLTASLGTASKDPAQYAPDGAQWVGYIPKSGLITSGSAKVSAIEWVDISDIGVTV